MPLPAPAERELLHLRDIALRGYRRADGLFDIEAQLTDTKTYPIANRERGEIPPGEPLHGMWLRLTIDEDMTVLACEAAADFTPFPACPQAAPNFARLAGLRIGPGFNRAVQERVGGVAGCTHLRELLAQMATVAFQTLTAVRRQREAVAAAADKQPALIGTCLAYAPDGEVVRSRWPQFARPAAE